MKLHKMTRPSMPLTPACAPSTLPPAAAAAVAVLGVEWAPVSRVHQVQVQAELAQALTRTGGINGTTGTSGFIGTNASKKLYADGGSGVPPRGRPV